MHRAIWIRRWHDVIWGKQIAQGEFYFQTKFSSRRRSSHILLRHYIALFFIHEIAIVSNLTTSVKKTNFSYSDTVNHMKESIILCIKFVYIVVSFIKVNIDSNNTLLPDETRPLYDPSLTAHQWVHVVFTLGQHTAIFPGHSYWFNER